MYAHKNGICLCRYPTNEKTRQKDTEKRHKEDDHNKN